jgi:hypothetical protein
MKIHFTVVFALFSAAAIGQINSMEWGMGYAFSLPRGTMAVNMKQAHGGFMDFYFTPATKRYAIGAEMSFNIYGYNKNRQTYTFDDGSTAPMDIVVNNSFYNIMAAGRYFLGTGKIQPFFTGKMGYGIYATSLNVYDPDDADHCEPVDTDVLKRDGTMIFAAGGGIRWEMLPKKAPGRFFLNLSTNYTSGGKVNYMNVDAPNHNHKAPTSDVYMKFLNTQTQMIHEHHVGYVYTSLVEMMDFRLSVTMKIQ